MLQNTRVILQRIKANRFISDKNVLVSKNLKSFIIGDNLGGRKIGVTNCFNYFSFKRGCKQTTLYMKTKHTYGILILHYLLDTFYKFYYLLRWCGRGPLWCGGGPRNRRQKPFFETWPDLQTHRLFFRQTAPRSAGHLPLMQTPPAAPSETMVLWCRV